jgi:hypothetical protein
MTRLGGASGKFLGTIRIAAPESLRGEDCRFAADVYSLGTIGYHHLTGDDHGHVSGRRHSLGRRRRGLVLATARSIDIRNPASILARHHFGEKTDFVC